MDNQDRPSTITEADALYAEARLDEALDLYQAALAEDDSNAWVHSRMGAILAQRNDLAGAEAAFLRALELDPRLPQAHSNLGNIYYARGAYQDALAKYQEAVALDADNPTFHENLHAVYKKLGRLNEAVSALKKAHRLGRTQAKAQAQEQLATMKRMGRGRGCLPFTALGLVTLVLLVIIGVVL